MMRFKQWLPWIGWLFSLAAILFLWAGLYLREERLRALLPFRRRVS